MNLDPEDSPHYLYKVLSVDDWQKSQGKASVQLSEADRHFIHFSTEAQLSRIVEKFWGKTPEYAILKVDITKVTGKLILEANPGGKSQYFHLYQGAIPMDAVVESKTIKKS